IALSSRGQLTVTYCLSEPPPDWGGLRGRINKQIIKEWMNLMQSTFLLTPSKSQMNILQSHSIRNNINMQSQNSSPTLEPQSPFMQPQSEETLRISPNLQFISETTLPLSIESKGSIIQSEQPNDNQKYEDYIIDVRPNLEPVFLSKKSRSLVIDPDLANAEESYGLLQGKIIVSGPSGMLSTVKQALSEMGFNEQNLIILH
ncbi:25698_t:CDS:1, partial [Gigaspora margarita]